MVGPFSWLQNPKGPILQKSTVNKQIQVLVEDAIAYSTNEKPFKKKNHPKSSIEKGHLWKTMEFIHYTRWRFH